MFFEFHTAPRIVFGSKGLHLLKEIVPQFGNRVLLVVGGHFAERSGLLDFLRKIMPVCATSHCQREPSVEIVDETVEMGKAQNCNLVVAVGGGSVLDCGKAAAGMLTNAGSLMDYLEGVGKGLSPKHPPVPMIAIPTTAGTGSEVTKNAVITGVGFKKSIRSPMLIPKVAIVDPTLTYGLPKLITAACGMDALTQLVESFLSTNANPVTDGLALQGIHLVGKCLIRAYQNNEDAEAREGMALASLLGGMCLANAGLGAVHGFASPLGALFPIPHGVACAALLPQVMRENLLAAKNTPLEKTITSRFAQVAEALTGERFFENHRIVERGLEKLLYFQSELSIPTLSDLGITEENIPLIVAGSKGSSMRYNPIDLNDEQLTAILQKAL